MSPTDGAELVATFAIPGEIERAVCSISASPGSIKPQVA
jgi:hypothetical protein